MNQKGVHMNTIDRTFLDYAEKEMTTELVRFSNGTLDTVKSTELAKVAVSEIDWSNSALMHKGISWIAKNFLQKLEIQKTIEK